MLYLFIAAACALAFLSGSLWLILIAAALLLTVIYPSILIFLGLLALVAVVLHFWNH